MAEGRAHILITGRVQGVFYRAFTEEVARSLRLGGWVRNTPEGWVEAVFEGEKADIAKAISQCYQGPPAAKVQGIDVKWEEFTGELSPFHVRYF